MATAGWGPRGKTADLNDRYALRLSSLAPTEIPRCEALECGSLLPLFPSQLAGGRSTLIAPAGPPWHRVAKLREYAHPEESGSKLPHSKASQRILTGASPSEIANKKAARRGAGRFEEVQKPIIRDSR